MNNAEIQKGKKVLIVDDEPDVLKSIEELLDIYIIDTACEFESAKKLLQDNCYDAAILDIMGVNGYELLEISTQKKIPTIILTAHALSADNFFRSLKRGAYAYLPKEKIPEISTFIQEILQTKENVSGKQPKWFTKLEAFFDARFGSYWKEKIEDDAEFWRKYPY